MVGSVAANAVVDFEEEAVLVVVGFGVGTEEVGEEVWGIRMEVDHLRDPARAVEEEEEDMAAVGMAMIVPLVTPIMSLFRLEEVEGIVIVTMLVEVTAADKSAHMRVVGTRSLGREEGIDGMPCCSRLFLCKA